MSAEDPVGPAAAGVLAALSALPGMGPRRLGALLGAVADPTEAWSLVTGGGAAAALADVPGGAGLAARWAASARTLDPAALAASHEAAGCVLLVPADPRFPSRLRADPEPPAVLVARGALHVLDRPTVALVGTRSCTPDGAHTAYELGRALAAAGVAVVSGLARGIDAAAHRGAVDAGGAAPLPAVGVVATGLDRPYPASSAGLWDALGTQGLLVTEAPLGTPPERWRFPARNRIIAGLADAVVVVESHRRGGSLHTVDAALERDVPVFAVPGPIRSPASVGSNALLADHAAPLCRVEDVLDVLGLGTGRAGAAPPVAPARPAPSGVDAVVLDALGWRPQTAESLLGALGIEPRALLAALHRLVVGGHVEQGPGWWARCPS